MSLVAVWKVLERPQVDDMLCQKAGAGAQCGAQEINQDDDGQIEGLAYRDPARVRLLVCQTTNPCECSLGAKEVLAQSVDAAPQLGRLMLLPLRNGFGEDTELTAEFAPDGRLLNVKYDSRKASGERAMEVVNGGLSEAEAFAASQSKAQADSRTAETAALDDQVRALKQQRDLLDARAALGADQVPQARRLEQLNREILQLDAEKKVGELRQALADTKN